VKRWNCVASVLVGLALASGFTTACSEDTPPPPVIEKSTLPPGEPIEPDPTASETARGEAIIRKVMIWPSDGTPPRDVTADYHECLAKMNESPKLRNVKGLAGVAWMSGCMTDRGWQVNPDAAADSHTPDTPNTANTPNTP
jgi:hypothetical protein